MRRSKEDDVYVIEFFHLQFSKSSRRAAEEESDESSHIVRKFFVNDESELDYTIESELKGKTN